MAATFPLAAASLADLLRIRSVTWSLERFVETSGVGTGEWLEAELGPPLWHADCETPPMTNDEVDQVMARFDLLDGGRQAFYLYNPARLGPQTDRDGAILGAASVKVKSVGSDNKSLALKGLPSGYVLSAGDFVAVDYGTPSRRALFRMAAGGTADGSGTAELELRPHVRPGIATDCAAYLFKPAAKMKLLPDTLRPSPVSTVHSTITFSARQTLQAG